MITSAPRASVVVPTHNRRDALARTLDGFDRQSCGPDAFEVVVVANACTDDSVAYVTARQRTTSYTLRIVDRVEPGVSAARNAGAGRSRAPLLIFVDDDIVPHPDFVNAHLQAHEHERLDGARPRIAIGYLPAVLQAEEDLFAITLRAWWEAMFDVMREPGHRFGYTDLLSGNFSLPRDTFLAAGGFDVRYRCHEDYELGWRLLEAGAEFVFAERAAGLHSDSTRFDRSCRRKREEGYADVQLSQQHPELRTALPLSRPRTLKRHVLWWMAFHAAPAGDALIRMLTGVLTMLERIGVRLAWLRLVYFIFGYWYARGVADALPRYGDLGALLEGAQDERQQHDARILDVGLDEGLEAAERVLDRERPCAARLTVAGRPFATLPYEPGREPLAGRHLRGALTRRWYGHYVAALVAVGRLRLPGDLPGSPTNLERPAGSGPESLVHSHRRAYGDAPTL